MEINGFRFFFGCASGSSRKAVRQLEEEDICISYATYHNKPQGFEKNLFIDCGGSPQTMKSKWNGDYPTSDQEYIEYIEEVQPEFFSLRDYPCEPEKLLKPLGRSVKEHQDMTIERHRNLLDLYDERDIEGKPISIIQGFSVEEYLDHYDRMMDQGLINDYVGVGSVCARDNAGRAARVLLRLREEIPDRIKIHAFGVKRDVLKFEPVIKAIDSADSLAYDMGAGMDMPVEKRKEAGLHGKSWKDSAYELLEMRRTIEKALLDPPLAEKKYEDYEFETPLWERSGMLCDFCSKPQVQFFRGVGFCREHLDQFKKGELKG